MQTALKSKDCGTVQGKLRIADAWANCGQLKHARDIYMELFSTHENTATIERINIGYETFLAKNEKDVEKAEQHFGQRKKYFCLPSIFLETLEGQKLVILGCNRQIKYLTKRMNELENLKISEAFGIEYKNYESLWDYHLFFIDPIFLMQSRNIFLEWMANHSIGILYIFVQFCTFLYIFHFNVF